MNASKSCVVLIATVVLLLVSTAAHAQSGGGMPGMEHPAQSGQHDMSAMHSMNQDAPALQYGSGTA